MTLQTLDSRAFKQGLVLSEASVEVALLIDRHIDNAISPEVAIYINHVTVTVEVPGCIMESVIFSHNMLRN